MKTMRPTDYHHDGFVATQAFDIYIYIYIYIYIHMIYIYISLLDIINLLKN